MNADNAWPNIRSKKKQNVHTRCYFAVGNSTCISGQYTNYGKYVNDEIVFKAPDLISLNQNVLKSKSATIAHFEGQTEYEHTMYVDFIEYFLQIVLCDAICVHQNIGDRVCSWHIKPILHHVFKCALKVSSQLRISI